MNPDDFFGLDIMQYEQQNQPRVRKRKVYQPLIDPRETMSDYDFKRHFRFSKDSVGRLTDLLAEDLELETNKGLPVPPLEQVCVALNHFGGGHFQRTSGWCSGVSQSTARECVVRVTDALIRRKNEFIAMPNVDQMSQTAEKMYQRFKLPRFSFAVDGMQVRFTEAPRRIPANKTKQMFWCRKQFYSVNAQVVASDNLIYDLDVGWPGSTHDARVWSRSEVKRHIEEQRRFLIAGDTGYPISEVLIKPYSTAEAGQDRRKRTFNRRLSGLRTVMSECIFGVWKRRFPILKGMRMDLELSQKVIVATAILFNIGRMWGDQEPDDGQDNHDNGDDADIVVVQDLSAGHIRLRGQIERDRLKDAMPMP